MGSTANILDPRPDGCIAAYYVNDLSQGRRLVELVRWLYDGQHQGPCDAWVVGEGGEGEPIRYTAIIILSRMGCEVVMAYADMLNLEPAFVSLELVMGLLHDTLATHAESGVIRNWDEGRAIVTEETEETEVTGTAETSEQP